MQLGKIHRDVGASGMSHYRKVVIIGDRLDRHHLLDGKADVGNAAQVLRLTTDVEFAGFRDHWWIGRQIMLDANTQVAAESEHVGNEGVFSKLDGIAVVEDSDRQ